MKLSSPFLRTTTTLAPCLLALAWLAAACSDDKTENPPVTPPDAATPMSDGAVPPPPDLDAGTITCGSNTCSSSFVGGSLGVACCAGTGGTRCGLNFNGTCIDQSSDAGFPMPPPSDAGPVVPDPSCGTVSITVMGVEYPLSGCCMPSGTCGWYVPVMAGIGCLSADQLRQGGATVPDAPIACAPDGGTNP